MLSNKFKKGELVRRKGFGYFFIVDNEDFIYPEIHILIRRAKRREKILYYLGWYR